MNGIYFYFRQNCEIIRKINGLNHRILLVKVMLKVSGNIKVYVNLFEAAYCICPTFLNY